MVEISKSRKGVIGELTLASHYIKKGYWVAMSLCPQSPFDLVVVDNRPDSPNYNKWESYIISERNHLSVLVPPEFVNGHLCLSNECLFHYTQSYPEEYVDWFDQEEVKWNDPEIAIEWPIKNPILNWRDK